MLFRSPLGNGRQNDPDDVLNAKRAFTRLGRYQPLRHGLNGIIDRELDQTIKRFQAEETTSGSTAGSRPGGDPAPARGAPRRSLAYGRRPQTGPARFLLDLPDWTPRLTDPKTGDDLLAPDGDPFTLGPSRTRDLLGQAERLGRRSPRGMSSSELNDLRRWREGLSQLWGSGMPQLKAASRPPIPTFKPNPPIPQLKPGHDDEDEEGWLSSLGRRLWQALDDFMREPSGGPTETPPLDPPLFPPPPAIPTVKPPRRGLRGR